jgi:hypothetical protein
MNAPSTLTVRVRYTKLWALASKDAGTATACVKPSPDGWTDVVATRAGSFNRVGVEPIELPGGHSPFLSQTIALVDD